MTEDLHKKQWESLRDLNDSLYKSTGDNTYKIRYEACKRLLGDEKPEEPKNTFIG